MTSFRLKMIALTTMIIDHIGFTFAAAYATYPLRVMGRVSFPVYAFLIAEGCRRTSDIKKYLFRLFVFALVSETAYDLFIFARPFDLGRQNIFFTLLFGALAAWVYDFLSAKKIPLAIALAWIPFAAAAQLLRTDYGALGVLAIYVCYVFNTPLQQAAALTAVLAVNYHENIIMCAAALASVLFIGVYNGRRGCPLRLVFYIIYPAHLFLLFGIKYLMY